MLIKQLLKDNYTFESLILHNYRIIIHNSTTKKKKTEWTVQHNNITGKNEKTAIVRLNPVRLKRLSDVNNFCR